MGLGGTYQRLDPLMGGGQERGKYNSSYAPKNNLSSERKDL